MTIYKVIVWNCGEFEVWEEYDLTRFYSSKEKAVERIKQLELFSEQVKEYLMNREYFVEIEECFLDLKTEDYLSLG